MATATATRTRSVKMLADGAVRITISGRETSYWLDRCEGDYGDYRCYRLTKHSDDSLPGKVTVYYCQVDANNLRAVSCECPAHAYRGHREPCKHCGAILALLRAGKLS